MTGLPPDPGTDLLAADVDRVLVVDFGAQYAQLIARRVREAGVYSEIVPHTIDVSDVESRGASALILSGGPKSVHVDGAPRLDPAVLGMGLPTLGICYGAQLMALELGGEVGRFDKGEYGRTELRLVGAGSRPGAEPTAGGPVGGELLGGREPVSSVWMSHFDAISSVPEGFTVTASSADAPVAAMEAPARRMWAVQFHPEVSHTDGGGDILRRFLVELAGCRPNWTPGHVVDLATDAIRAQVGSGRAICGLSGGVDSAVAAALVHRAIGSQLTCVFVDTGLMRAGEGEQVVETFRRHQGIELIHVRAGDRFLERLAGITDPETKRKEIGELFIRVFEEASSGLSDARFLVQGTLYPDVIESGTTTAAKIKSHHNVGGLPDDMDFELVEPLRALFKDEVRAVGHELGLPDEIVWRQPFPGPGLAVRVVGEVTPERVALLQQADAIVRAELAEAGLEREIWQSFAVLLADVRSVGVMGDERTYGHPIVVRAVVSEDAMTADWARLPDAVLDRIGSRIVAEVPGVNRVLYDVTSKPPGTIEWE